MELSYKNIVLKPGYSEIQSRNQVKTKKNFLSRDFNSVAIPANMACTIDFKMADFLSEENYFYILHRFHKNREKLINWIKKEKSTTSISLGVKKEDKEILHEIKKYPIDYITIDVAHGHHILVKKMIKEVRKNTTAKIIAGNVGTVEGVADLVGWGADAVKVGLSMGKSCTTYNVTGVGTPMFSTINNIRSFVGSSIPIIADGQIREIGDICKALVAGADMVMIGSEFAKRKDSPAESLVTDDGLKKVFYGSASFYNTGNTDFIEGDKVLLDQSEDYYLDYYRKIDQGIKSCASYAGVDEVEKLRNMKWSWI